jgi:hypothetical protein
MQIVVDNQNVAHHGPLPLPDSIAPLIVLRVLLANQWQSHISAANLPGCLPPKVNKPDPRQVACVRSDEATAVDALVGAAP